MDWCMTAMINHSLWHLTIISFDFHRQWHFSDSLIHLDRPGWFNKNREERWQRKNNSQQTPKSGLIIGVCLLMSFEGFNSNTFYGNVCLNVKELPVKCLSYRASKASLWATVKWFFQSPTSPEMFKKKFIKRILFFI